MVKYSLAFLFLFIAAGQSFAGDYSVVRIGYAYNQVDIDMGNEELDGLRPWHGDPYTSFLFHKQFGSSGRHYLGTGIDLTKLKGDTVIGFRALNYKFQKYEQFAIGSFFGAASMDSGKPQNGYYFGLTGEWQFAQSPWSLEFEGSFFSGLARDRIESDPPGTKVDHFVDAESYALFINYQF